MNLFVLCMNPSNSKVISMLVLVPYRNSQFSQQVIPNQHVYLLCLKLSLTNMSTSMTSGFLNMLAIVWQSKILSLGLLRSEHAKLSSG